jgi:hypothetical protein
MDQTHDWNRRGEGSEMDRRAEYGEAGNILAMTFTRMHAKLEYSDLRSH